MQVERVQVDADAALAGGVRDVDGPGDPQEAVSETSTAWSPPRSESSQKRATALLTSEPPYVQPAGNASMHGSRVALGTDCAIRTNSSPSSIGHVGFRGVARPRAAATRGRQDHERSRRPCRGDAATSCERGPVADDQAQREEGREQHADREEHAPDAPPLDRDLLACGREPPELGQEVAAVLLEVVAELGRARDAARGGERLGDLVLG